MATFKIEPHSIEPGRAAVCVFDDAGEFVATVIWRDDSVVVVSKFMESVTHDKGTPPVAVVKLRPRK